jgi:cytochrome c553
MKKIILTLLLGLGVLNTAAALEGSAEAGKTKSAMCAACHGVDGNSLVPMYPKLAGQSAAYIAKQLAEFKAGMMSGGKEGRVDPVMGGMTMALSEQDMADLGAYYAAQTSTAGNGSADALGKSLYLNGDIERGITACIACHSIDGNGMPSAGFPAVASQNVDYLKGQLTKFRDGTRANDTNAMMRNIAIKLEDADIAALTQYMSSLK